MMGKAGGAKLNSGSYSKAPAEKHRARGAVIAGRAGFGEAPGS